MRTKGASNWTEERAQELRLLWTDTTLSASRIAKVMGGGLTRNSVLGKAHRMELPKRAPAGPKGLVRKANRPKAQPKPKAWVEPKRSRMGFKAPIDLPPAPKPKGEAWEPIDGITPVSLADLDNGQCKWPVTEDAPFLFCGAEATQGSYCHHHHLWSIGQGTAPERSAIANARLAVFKERAIPDRHREAA